MTSYFHPNHHIPWNKGKLIGQKAPLKLKEIWAIRVRLQMRKNPRNLALFNLAIDSKLSGCDLVKLRVNDIYQSAQVLQRATILQQKTKRGRFSSKSLHRPENRS